MVISVLFETGARLSSATGPASSSGMSCSRASYLLYFRGFRDAEMSDVSLCFCSSQTPLPEALNSKDTMKQVSRSDNDDEGNQAVLQVF